MREEIFAAGGWLLLFGILITSGGMVYNFATDWEHAQAYVTLGSLITVLGGGLAIYGILSAKKSDVDRLRPLSLEEILNSISKGYSIASTDLKELEITIKQTKDLEFRQSLTYIRDAEKKHLNLLKEIKEATLVYEKQRRAD